MVCRGVLWLLLGASLFSASLTAQPYHPALDPSVFPVPESLRPAVQFWRDIFSRYRSDQTVVHDDWHLGIVYGVVDASDLVEAGYSASEVARQLEKRSRKEVERYHAILRHLAGDRAATGLDTTEIARVESLMADVPGGRARYRDAAHRVRGQRGLKDRFAEAIEISGMFLPGIERILEAEGLPLEIRCMPFVESMFNYRARSKVGASGAWQFTRSTGRLYLQIDAAVDARSDVLLAADGAARLLADNYRRVESWPLALTGYNHGIAGMRRAARKLGTKDIGVVVEKYRSRTFGFASRNFYAEFVAAVVVFAERNQFFPDVEPLPELRFDEFVAPSFVSLTDLAQVTGTDVEALEELNPALHSEVVTGRLLVPSSYPLRVPEGQLAAFDEAYRRLPSERKPSRQLATRYRVRSGDSLGLIARRHGTTVAALQRANALPRADRIYIGQILEIPNRGRDWGPLVLAEAGSERPSERPAEYVVRGGDTLAGVAYRHDLTVDSLVAWNSLSSPDRLAVGQVLRLAPSAPDTSSGAPGGSDAADRAMHEVRRGETLSRIAVAYGTTVRALMSINGLSNSLIQVGQVLRIPTS